MRVATRPSVLFGVPALLAIAVAVFLAMWALGPGGGGSAEQARATSNVEYIVRDASGAIKVHEFVKNETTSRLLDAAAERLSEAGDPGTSIFVSIALCQVSGNTVAVANGFTPDVPCTSLVGNMNAAGTNTNPSDLLTPIDGSNTYQVSVQFTATGTSDIVEMQLVRIPTTNVPPAAINIGAVRMGTISLDTNDTLTVTWDVTLS